MCAYHWWDRDTGYRPYAIKRIIKCAVAHYPVQGGARKALYIAWRESRFDPYATNGSFKGVYQRERPGGQTATTRTASGT